VSFWPIAKLREPGALLNIGTLYLQREIFLAGKQPALLPDYVLNMLTSLRVWRSEK
jgi:hypothetical protein